MGKVRVAIVGIGNCASSLIQGLHYYASKSPDEAIGVMHWNIGGYNVTDLEVVAGSARARRGHDGDERPL